MKNTLKILSFIMLAFFVSCDEASQGEDNSSTVLNYGFKMATDNFDIPASNPVYEIVVFATEPSNVDRVVNVTMIQPTAGVAEALQPFTSLSAPTDVISYDTAITIPAGSKSGKGNVVLTTDNAVLPIGTTKKVSFNFTAPGDGVVNISQDRTTINYTPECLNTKVKLTFNLDQYPEETGWSLTKGGVVIASKAANSYAGSVNATVSQVLCLESGAYTLTVTDSYGDGITGANPFVVEIVGGSVLVSNVPFPGSSVTSNFTIN